ncbi:MAG: cytochrome C oxidase subunit IV family protein [Pseudomonadota bacterium]
MAASHFKITLVWIILCLTTVFSVGASGEPTDVRLAIAVLGAAFVKVFLVMHYFMELDEAPPLWRGVFAGWTVIVFSVLSGLLLIL